MKNHTRRNFLRTTSLTAGSLFFLSYIRPIKISGRKSVLGCAPSKNNLLLTGTLSTVQSGKWSDPATWGGRLPTDTDVPVISSNHSIIYDQAMTIVAGVNISNNGTLIFDPLKTTTLESSGNIIVMGTLQMHSGSPTVIQTLRFRNIDESKFVGGGMDPIETDVGLWVMGNGQLDLLGASKTSWTRASGDINAGANSITLEMVPEGWQVGDELSIAPTSPPTVGESYILGFDERIVSNLAGSTISLNKTLTYPHPKVNNLWTAEVMNLTRTVRIEGTAAGRTHLFIRSSKKQLIKNIALRYMGPRKDKSGDNIQELIAGRYGMHFHHSMDGSRGSLIDGNIIRDAGNHSYVPHVSHGITFKNNIAYNVTETAFWWDPGDATHDVVWDHNIVAICKYAPGSKGLNPDDGPSFSASGFALNTGDDNICINNTVVAASGDPGNGGAYNWDAVVNEGVWKFKDNLAHNNINGLRVWQNSTRNHVIENFEAYHNGLGIFHGAYANSYTYNGGSIFGNEIQIKAASTNTNRVRFENLFIDGAGIIDICIRVIHSPLSGAVPIFLRNNIIKGHRLTAISDEADEGNFKNIDIIQCQIAGTASIIHPLAGSTETIRIQPVAEQTYQITKTTKTAINQFAPTLWGNGTGLKGEYFNSTDLTNPAFTRIDSNVSFSEWASGVHYKITSNKYSVRWTGQIQPQFSENYIFYLGSGGGHRLWINNKLIVDGWTENYPDRFKSIPISLIAGERYDIRLEYFNDNANSVIGLFWSCPSLSLEYVPQSQLYPSKISSPQLPNSNPIANAGADVIISLPANGVKLNGIGSFDPDGTLVSYKWSKVQGPEEYFLANPDSISTLVTNLVEGIYIFRLSVTDNFGATAQDEVMVSVTAAPSTNTELIANAGSDIMITLPRNFTTLNGSASVISDPGRSRCNWQKLSGPSQYTIANPTALSTSLNNLVEGVYLFKLTLTHDNGKTSEDEIKITVNPVETLPSLLTITAFPNPTTTYFQIKVTSNSDQGIKVRIINRWGVVVATYYNLHNNSIITTSSNIRSGIYYAIAEQGVQKKIITLMKL